MLKRTINLILVISAAGFFASSLFAVPTAQAIAKGYATDDTQLVSGMMVALDSEGETAKVSRVTPETASKTVGVVTTIADSAVAITSARAQVYVESQGEVQAYVTDVNGAVARGDALVAAPLKGMLMKASGDAGETILALSDAKFTTDTAEVVTLQGGKTAHVGRLLVNLDQKSFGLVGGSETTLQKLGKSVTGRSVSELRVLIAVIIFVVVMIAEGAIVYGGITSAITAIGRNPLAREYIKHELVRVLVVVCGVLGVGLVAIYTILWA